jgi:SAM-dependent methyltransferase
MSEGSDNGYLLSNDLLPAQSRLKILADIFDPWTFSHVRNLGIGPGWRCWEVGAGGATVTRWLSEQVGDKGKVVATDIDVSWVKNALGSNVEILQHDAALDPPPNFSFDIVHCRLLLVHVKERDRALANMVSALRPGGWILVEEADPALQPLSCINPVLDEEILANAIRLGFRTLMTRRGVDLEYGRKLPRLLREAGLIDIGADAYFPVANDKCSTLELVTIQMIKDQLIAAGLFSESEINQHVENVGSGILDLTQPPLISAWGRKLQ